MGSEIGDFVYKKRFKVDKRTPLQMSILHSHYKLPTFARLQPTNLHIRRCLYSQKAFFLFLLFFFSMFCPPTQASEDMLFFDPSPMSQDVLEGDDILLRCDVSNRDKITFHWIYNGDLFVLQFNKPNRFSNIEKYSKTILKFHEMFYILVQMNDYKIQFNEQTSKWNSEAEWCKRIAT